MVEGGRSGKTSESMDSSLIVHTEDAVQALLDHLVEPLLPAKPSAHNVPSLSERETVAKQMHAVVLLYNYYHRKSYPHLEFLSFESFCKVAVNAKPSLLMHMRLMRGSNNCKLDNLDEQLSVAEKVIMDACNISIGLDASKDVPSMEGWPVSKVTVFLIDSMKNNCMLLFGLISLGVWSLIEKELDDPNSDLSGVLAKDVNKKKRINRRPMRGEKNSNEDGYLKVAFSAVKETTGIDEADIMVLESHTVYSLTKEKASARFNLIQSTKSTNEDTRDISIPHQKQIKTRCTRLKKNT